jgi:hypothetical protein
MVKTCRLFTLLSGSLFCSLTVKEMMGLFCFFHPQYKNAMNGNSKERLSYRELRVGATQSKADLKLAREQFGRTATGKSFSWMPVC